MDHLTIEEHNVVERYLLGQLGAEEAMRFEQHFLDCPRCLEELNVGEVLHQGLKGVAAEDVRFTGVAVLAWLYRRGRVFQGAIALALLTVVILPWALLAPRVAHLEGERERLADTLNQALAPRAGTLSYALSPERSGLEEEPSTLIALGSQPKWVVLSLPLPPSRIAAPSMASYRVRLFAEAGENLWQSEQIQPDAAGRVVFSVHSSWLETSTYRAELDAVTSTGETQPVARFAFEVRRER